MQNLSKPKLYALTLALTCLAYIATACSTYKVTSGGKTMVGSNYDTWFETPRIWFETTGYGASFTGARQEGKNVVAPQTGLNEHGLSFVTLATAMPENGVSPKGKKQITNRSNYLKDILHTCKNVAEVKAYVDQYDHSTLSGDVFLYTDKTGNYLVVEPYETILGNEAKYVLANFCPSTITDFSTIKQARYVNGTTFLANKIDSSLAFCTALSDTMHVCRKKLGDGTLLTSILDLNDGIVNLYFYHDYKHPVQFNLKEELMKGDHFLEIPALFPVNAEFNALVNFKTPMNTPALDWFLRFCMVLFFASAVFYFISYFIKRASTKLAYLKLILAGLSVIMLFYTLALETQMNIYYFPAPYKHYQASWLNIAAYVPFLIAVIIIPFFMISLRIIKQHLWSITPKYLFMFNNLVYLVLIALFGYWGLYNVMG